MHNITTINIELIDDAVGKGFATASTFGLAGGAVTDGDAGTVSKLPAGQQPALNAGLVTADGKLGAFRGDPRHGRVLRSRTERQQ